MEKINENIPNLVHYFFKINTFKNRLKIIIIIIVSLINLLYNYIEHLINNYVDIKKTILKNKRKI